MDNIFFEEMKSRTKDTNMFAYDFCPNHLYKFDGDLTIIDLEGVYNLNEYELKKEEHDRLGIPGRFIEYEPYQKYIDELCYLPLSKDEFLNKNNKRGL